MLFSFQKNFKKKVIQENEQYLFVTEAQPMLFVFTGMCRYLLLYFSIEQPQQWPNCFFFPRNTVLKYPVKTEGPFFVHEISLGKTIRVNITPSAKYANLKSSVI